MSMIGQSFTIRKALLALEQELQRRKVTITPLPASSRYPHGAQQIERAGRKSIVINAAPPVQLTRTGDFS